MNLTSLAPLGSDRSEPLSRAAMASGVIGILLAGGRLWLNGSGDALVWVIGATAIGFGLCAWLMTLTGGARQVGVHGFPVWGVMGLLIAGALDRGLHSDAFLWVPFAAMMGYVALPRRAAIGLTAVAMLVPTILLVLHERGIISPNPPLGSMLRLRLGALLGAIVFGAVAAHAFRRWRENSVRQGIAERQRLEFVMDSLTHAILLVDDAGVIIAGNKRVCEMFLLSCAQEDLVGQRANALLVSGENPPVEAAWFSENLSAGQLDGKQEVVLADGRIFETDSVPMEIEQDRIAHLWSWHEVTGRVQSYANVVTKLQRDELTNAYSRSHLTAEIDRACQLAEPFTVFYVDLDGFKQVNDQFGHGRGDELLRDVATELDKAMRTTDLVGRLGGDEFCLLARGVGTHAQASIVASKLLAATRSAAAELDTDVTASVGAALFPEAGETASALIESADRAMYIAKEAGRDRSTIAEPISRKSRRTTG